MRKDYPEIHRSQHIGWLRAAVLGANDGLVSTASLVMGVAAAEVSHSGIFIAGMAGWVAGAMSMAAGEYVSVSSQADTEKADLEKEREELEIDFEQEKVELAGIYVRRGLTLELAWQVAEQLMRHDALGAHARDELGITEVAVARQIQAALTSALTFSVGASAPLLAVIFTPTSRLIPIVWGLALGFLAISGGLAAYIGGARLWPGALRVTFWGALAMGVTMVVGHWFGAGG